MTPKAKDAATLRPVVTEGPALAPITLTGQTVVLEPLRPEHWTDLQAAAAEEELWRYMGMQAHTPDALRLWIDLRLRHVQNGTAIAFVIRDAKTRRAIGSTSLFDYARLHRRIEIGHTWLGKTHRGTGANPEAKLLLLYHAFERLHLVRVQLKTDPNNQRSRKAILKIGAKEEGILRNYTTYLDGTVHDRVFFSIIDREWPTVKKRLEDLVAARAAPT